MATSIPETYRIADLLQWYREKTLVVNEEFQRRSVWTDSAKSYLIDTILRRLPVPMMYMRTKVNPKTQKAFREVVDGQQRLRTFVDFASNKVKLDKRAGEFSGLCYADLDPEAQEAFLSYPITVVQLINAQDDDVLEVFSRLNVYNVQLNAAELRHAKYQGDFKWAVYAAAKRWSSLWEKYHIVSKRQRVRMADDALMAEMLGILLHGVTDGGQRKIDQLYERYENHPWDQETVIQRLDRVLKFADENLGPVMVGNLARAPHFLMLFAGLAHALEGIPLGDMGEQMPQRDPAALTDIAMPSANLRTLEEIIDLEIYDLEDTRFLDFWRTSSGTTQRIASRKVRFPVYYRALLPRPL